MPDTSANNGFYLKFPQKRLFLTLVLFLMQAVVSLRADIPLFWWQPGNGTTNFGDELSRVIVERVIQRNVEEAKVEAPKLLAIGSVLHFADTGDCIWGSGINGKHLNPNDYRFKKLDIRSVRGPLTRLFLQSMGHMAPEIYGDPALLISTLFPEFHAPAYGTILSYHMFLKRDSIAILTTWYCLANLGRVSFKKSWKVIL